MAKKASYTAAFIAAGATKESAYAAISHVLQHLVPLGIDLVSISQSGNGTLSVVLSDAVPTGQLAHLGLVVA